jgi:hypothetical protein
MKDSTTVQDKITITMRKQKEIRDDRVAVITSPVGWWTEYHNYDLLFDPILVNWIEQIEQIYLKEDELVWDIEIERICKLMEEYLNKEYPDFQFPPAIGLSLNIQWVSVGEKFRIVERYRYGEWDETVELLTDTQWLDA